MHTGPTMRPALEALIPLCIPAKFQEMACPYYFFFIIPTSKKSMVHIAFVLFVRSFPIPFFTLYPVYKISQKVFELGLRVLADLLGLRIWSPY